MLGVLDEAEARRVVESGRHGGEANSTCGGSASNVAEGIEMEQEQGVAVNLC